MLEQTASFLVSLFKLADFLLRMQLTECIKSYFVHAMTKKNLLEFKGLKEVWKFQFYRVSFPTLVLYISVLLSHSLLGRTAKTLCRFLPP